MRCWAHQEDDRLSHRRGGHFYYATERGKQYPIYRRKSGSLPRRGITLDLNVLPPAGPSSPWGLLGATTALSPTHTPASASTRST
jgi:hypothetical protein